MQIYEVVKAFNTVNRRLVVGSTVSDAEDLSPFSIEERCESKFLKAKAEDRPAPDPVRSSRKVSAEPGVDDPK